MKILYTKQQEIL